MESKKSNTEIITAFYSAFQKKDAETMVSFYDENIIFEDPAFGKLIGKDAKNMWRMLCQNSSDIKITFEIIKANDKNVTAHWNADYNFSKTGRFVKNSIDATFEIENGKIISHRDVFNLWKWSQQAFGLTGWLIGWSPLFRNKLQKTTNGMLEKFGAKA